jgi:hypothetical protein
MTIKNILTFLEHFPAIEPPILLSVEEITTYSRENKPFSQGIVREVFIPFESQYSDEQLVEFIPCFSLPSDSRMHVLVYYRGDLFINEYNLLTMNNKGTIIDKKAIAGTFLDKDKLIRYVASIDKDGLIQVVIGSNKGARDFYNPLNSKTITYEIAPDGTIILSSNTN